MARKNDTYTLNTETAQRLSQHKYVFSIHYIPTLY